MSLIWSVSSTMFALGFELCSFLRKPGVLTTNLQDGVVPVNTHLSSCLRCFWKETFGSLKTLKYYLEMESCGDSVEVSVSARHTKDRGSSPSAQPCLEGKLESLIHL